MPPDRPQSHVSLEVDPSGVVENATALKSALAEAAPLESALLATGGVVALLYLVGYAALPRALDFAGMLTGLLAVAVTVLWIGDAI